MKTSENITDFERLNSMVIKVIFSIALKINVICFAFLFVASNFIALEEKISLYKVNVVLFWSFIALQVFIPFLIYSEKQTIDSEHFIKRIEKEQESIKILCKQFLHSNFTLFDVEKFRKELKRVRNIKIKDEGMRAKENRIKQDQSSQAYKYFSNIK